MSSEIDTSPFSRCLDNNLITQAQESKSKKTADVISQNIFFSFF